MQINRILVLTELNKISDIAIEYSISLANQLNVSEIVLLNMILPAHSQIAEASNQAVDPNSVMANELNTAMLEKHKNLMLNQAKKYSNPLVNIEAHVKFKTATSQLNEYMEEFDAGLLVFGSNTNHNFFEVLIGSKTEKLVRKMNYPMIVISEEPDSYKVEKLALAVDIEEKNHDGIDEIIDFANSLNAKIQLVYVITNSKIRADEAISSLHSLAQSKRISKFSINVVNNPDLEDGLEGFIKKHKSDMIAVLSQGKGKLHKLIFGSNTEDIINELEAPVFVCSA